MAYLLFDFDGTLADSMEMWRTMATKVLKTYGIDLPIEEDRATASMSHQTACQYYADKYLDGQGADKLLADFNAILEKSYGETLELKAHVRPVLDQLKAAGVPMAIASSTDERLLRMAVDRFGLQDHFVFIQSVDNAGHSKDSAEYYQLAADRFGAQLEDMTFFDDALYAVKRAESTGLKTIAVYDPANKDQWEDIKAAASGFIQDFSEFPLADFIS